MTLQRQYEPPADQDALEAARQATLEYVERLRVLNLSHYGLGDLRKEADGLLGWIDDQLLDLAADEANDLYDQRGDWEREQKECG